MCVEVMSDNLLQSKVHTKIFT